MNLYLLQFLQFTPENGVDFQKLFKRVELKKGHFLREAGSLSKKVYFFEKGLARSWYVNSDKNITHLFFSENSFSLSIESAFYNQPSTYYLELLEDSIIFTTNFTKIEAFAEHVPKMERVIRN